MVKRFAKICKCKKKPTQRRISRRPSAGRPIPYPDPEVEIFNDRKVNEKTFHIDYKQSLSSKEKMILNSFQYKYLYYAIDDILKFCKNQNYVHLLEIIYAPVLYLHNNQCINFFDMWITDLYITRITNFNKFLTENVEKDTNHYVITITLSYKTGVPKKEPQVLW